MKRRFRPVASVPPLPTRLEDWRRTARRVGSVLASPAYAVLALVVAVLSVLLFVLPENARLVWDVVLTGPMDLNARFRVLVYLLPIVGGVDPVVDVGVLVVGALSGIAIATALYRFRATGNGGAGSGGAGLGVAVGVFGGCAACGSALLAAAFGAGAAGALAALPFGGAEVPWLAAGLLTLSIFWLVEGFEVGDACSIDDRR